MLSANIPARARALLGLLVLAGAAVLLAAATASALGLSGHPVSARADSRVAGRIHRRARAHTHHPRRHPRPVTVTGAAGATGSSPATSAASSSATLATPASPVAYAAGVSLPAAGAPVSPLAAMRFYVNPNSNAAQQARSWQSSQPANAAEMAKIAAQPAAAWFGDWNSNVATAVSATVNAAAATGEVAQLVAYNIPQRDCGGYSSGGATSASAYRAWIRSFAAGIGGRQAVVILEPDAIAGLGCLSAADQATRLSLLSDAVTVLRSLPGVYVYLDAGNAGWQPVSVIAGRLTQANVAGAAGFALNVSNFDATASETTYGQSVSALIGGKHFVIDTSRNGLGSNGQWCNPSGRALGARPTAATGNPLVDALLWIKSPGQSDGTCNGGPSAGTWWPAYALGLAQRAAY